jgi:hypothetical protein
MTDFIMFIALLWRQEYRLRCKGNLTTGVYYSLSHLFGDVMLFHPYLFQNVPFYFTFEVMPLVHVRISYLTIVYINIVSVNTIFILQIFQI